jgi:ABC-type transport system involved in cytochrome bd biosynthesis fused ATPase/permease subunit
MRRLRVTIRLLAAVLLALAVRVVISGINVVTGLTGALVAGLLIVSLLLARQGRRLEPTSRRERGG